MSKKVLFAEFPEKLPIFTTVVEEYLPEGFEVINWNDIKGGNISEALADVEYFLILGQRITREMMDAAPRLRLIQRTGQGYDNVDIAAAAEKGIPVAIMPTGNAVAVAEHAILLPLALYRHLREMDSDMRAGKWPGLEYRESSYEMEGKVHGFLGFGNIGRLAARRSKAFGTKIIYHDVVAAAPEVEAELGATRVSLEELLQQSDILSIHMPLLPSTRGMIGAEQFKLMKKSALLINTARGPIVDEEALCDALENGTIAGAGLDTFSSDPVAPDARIRRMPNILMTPHVAGGTGDTFRKQAKGAIDQIIAVENGEDPKFVVNGVKTAPKF